MDVSPRNAGTITLEGEEGDVREPTIYPTPYDEPIDCFDRNEVITMTANPKAGYQFDYWEFNYWPEDLNENLDKTSNPLTFTNSYLANDDNDSDGYSEAKGDCNDNNASIHPDAEEICGDDIDQDCSGYDLLCDGSNENENKEYPIDYNDIRAITAHFTSGSSPPEAPKNVTATDGTITGKVVVSWSSSVGTNNYNIFRANTLQDSKIQIGQTAETTFEDTTVDGVNKYYYWIQAVNLSGASAYSDPDSGYAYVDAPPLPVYTSSPITPEDAKKMLDTDPEVIVLDVSPPDEYDKNHIICAINGTITVFGNLNSSTYLRLAEYTDFPVLVYDPDGSESKSAADDLAGNGFSDVYYMTGGLKTASNMETVNSDQTYDCSLPPMALAVQAANEVEEAQTVYLDGTGSEATDGNSLTTYEWTQYQKTEVDIINADSAEAMITSPNLQGDDEQLIFLLTVTDSQNVKDTDSVAVNVKWENDSPAADAGKTQSVTEGTPVILDGGNSSDYDDGIVAYLWEAISTEPEVTLKDSTKESASFTAPNIDTETAELIFKLTVTDKGGLYGTDQVRIFVSRNNAPPVADAGPDRTIPETQQVQLDGSGSIDMDDGIKTYSWTQIGGVPTVSLSSLSAVQPTFTAPEVADGDITLEFQLTVTDQSGDINTDQVDIIVSDLGNPPMADAGTDQNPVYEGWQVSLDGSGSTDTDGIIQSYHWTQMNTPYVSLINADSATPEFTAPMINEESVTLVFQLTVSDDTSLNGTDQVKIVVKKSAASPEANAGADQEVDEGNTVLLDGSGSSDPDDGISQYSWQQTGGEPLVNISDSSAVKQEFDAPDVDQETILTFTLTVTDYSETLNTDEVQIRIRPKSGSSSSSCFISTLGS